MGESLENTLPRTDGGAQKNSVQCVRVCVCLCVCVESAAAPHSNNSPSFYHYENVPLFCLLSC